MRKPRTGAKARTLIVVLALAPAIAALAIVAIRYGRQLADSQSRSLGLAALGFGGVYLVLGAIALQRRAPVPKIALAGWSAAIAFVLVFVVQATLQSFKVDSRVHADSLRGMDWVPEYFRQFKESEESHWQPYVHWRRAPYEGEQIHVDRFGRRRTWTAQGLGNDAPRIFMFGGSTLWGTGAPDDDTIPSYVARRLASEGTPAHVENYGESGYVSTQGLIRLMLELRRQNVPDVVVFYDGVNEVGAALESAQPGLPYSESNRRADYLMGRGGKPPTPPVLNPAELAQQVAEYYRGNLRVLAGLGKEYGFEVICFWQPLPYIDKPLTDYESKASKVGDARRKLVDLVYDAIAQEKFPVEFHDLRSIFATETEPRYLDWCHLSPQGNAEIAQAMLSSIRAALQRHRASPPR